MVIEGKRGKPTRCLGGTAQGGVRINGGVGRQANPLEHVPGTVGERDIDLGAPKIKANDCLVVGEKRRDLGHSQQYLLKTPYMSSASARIRAQ